LAEVIMEVDTWLPDGCPADADDATFEYILNRMADEMATGGKKPAKASASKT